MFILLLLLCAAVAAAASPTIPPIDGVDRSGFFNYMKQEFDKRRMFVNIVDTVSSESFPSSQVTASHKGSRDTVAIGVMPSDKHPDLYGFLSRKIEEALGCDDVSDAEFGSTDRYPEYVLTVDESNLPLINRDEENVDDGVDMPLLNRVALQAGMVKDDASNIELTDCWYMRSPEMMRINVVIGAGTKIRSGWIVERYPLGKFHRKPEMSYRFPVYRTNYSYIDGWNSRTIIDVYEENDDHGNRVWTPTGWPAFAREDMEQIAVKDTNDFTLFRETETGLLVTTLSHTMSLSYSIDDQAFEEKIRLDGDSPGWYHVSCDRKQGSETKDLLVQGYPSPTNKTTNDGVFIQLSSSYMFPLHAHSFQCSPKRETRTGIPEVLQLNYVDVRGSQNVPSSDREVSIRKLNVPYILVGSIPVLPEEPLEKAWTPAEIEEIREQANAATTAMCKLGEAEHEVNTNKAEEALEKKALTDLLIMMAIVAVLAVTTVVCIGACVRMCIRKSRDPVIPASIKATPSFRPRYGADRRREDGQCELAETALQPIDAINNKCEEEEEKERKASSLASPTRSNSGKKKSISFAPRKPSMRTEDLVKMINDTSLGPRIDAMVEAGPDGEEEEESKESKEKEQKDEHAAPAALTSSVLATPEEEVVDETSSGEVTMGEVKMESAESRIVSY